MKKLLVGSLLAALGVLGLSAPAWALTGQQSLVIFHQDDQPEQVIASGPISGVGTDVSPSNNHDVSTETFPQGSFVVTHPATNVSQSFNPVACVGTFDVTGPYSLSDGTGAFTGISGSGTFRATGVVIAEPTAQGCSEEPVAIFSVTTATGTTTLP